MFECGEVGPEHSEVTFGGDVGPADWWEQGHECGCCIGSEFGLEGLVEVVAVAFVDGHRDRPRGEG